MNSPTTPHDIGHLDDLRLSVVAQADGTYLALALTSPHSATGASPRAALLALVDQLAPAEAPPAPNDRRDAAVMAYLAAGRVLVEPRADGSFRAQALSLLGEGTGLTPRAACHDLVDLLVDQAEGGAA